MKKIVEEKYLGLLTKAFESVVGFPVKVEILCETSSNPEKKELSPRLGADLRALRGCCLPTVRRRST